MPGKNINIVKLLIKHHKKTLVAIKLYKTSLQVSIADDKNNIIKWIGKL